MNGESIRNDGQRLKECWRIWCERQTLAGSDINPDRVRLAIETHLARIALHRPLDDIADPEQRLEVEVTRDWFRKDFLDGLLD